MTKVSFMGLTDFQQIYNQNEFSEMNPGLACLSILDTSQKPFNINPNWVDSRQVVFDDTDHPLNPNALSLPNAKHIVKYLISVKNNSKVNELFVHCFAGVSRSRAVCLFFDEVLNKQIHEDINRTPYITHNRFVYSQLVRAYREIMYES